MKTKTVVLMLGAASVWIPAASAQASPNICTNSALAGTYSLSCNGWVAAGAGGALVPMMQVGVVTSDADGNWAGASTINIGGQMVVPGAKVAGSTTVNPDCTGNITYNKGTATELNISYVANPKSDQIHGLVIDKGTVVTCVLQRITYR